MRASLFITCYNDTLFPETGRAVVSLLERLGVDLDFLPRKPAADRCMPTPASAAKLSRKPDVSYDLS